ncbi:carbon storage regulator [Stenotrophomonas maltophilia]|uniref:carbon storage regulator n=1 Tax=Stenotrophomonas maltophilia TaxID=40324 RepID=UPI0015F1F6D4|nr:carbon storage regulator [Stenotrophomonas maltophilia]MDZ5788534.1 carbon storage regulator [Stenotrophomonas maltophilia]QDY47279.1 carbon storage regulator [Stenotrophomonas maltophilia]
MRKENPTQQGPGVNRPAGSKVINQSEGGLIRIGDSIDVVVLKARGGHARVVISAPRHLEIAAPKQ